MQLEIIWMVRWLSQPQYVMASFHQTRDIRLFERKIDTIWIHIRLCQIREEKKNIARD